MSFHITTTPLELTVSLLYTTNGVFQGLAVVAPGVPAFTLYPDHESPGDLFNGAVERVMAMRLTRVVTPV